VEAGAPGYGIVGKADGHAAQVADVAIVVRCPPERRTPHVESFQAILWHLLGSHPDVEAQPGQREAVDAAAAPSGPAPHSPPSSRTATGPSRSPCSTPSTESLRRRCAPGTSR